jgi:hypothetical protein
MTFTATITKTQNAQPVGVYTVTAIDNRKVAADILLTASEGGGYSISSKIALKGRGIKSYSNGNYSVTDAALAKLRQSYAVECDF